MMLGKQPQFSAVGCYSFSFNCGSAFKCLIPSSLASVYKDRKRFLYYFSCFVINIFLMLLHKTYFLP